MSENYDFKSIEKKWQEKWEKINLFKWDKDKEGLYFLMMYPYPSGALHMGHVLNYTIGDVLVRYFISRGKNILSPMGWDSFGLPAENAAIRAKIHPKEYTSQNIARMREQIKRAGWGYDWSLEIATSHPGYYKWTQWLFLKFYENGLAFKKTAPVNWCPKDQTVLANEQVHNGRCERCGTPVEQKDLEQWFFKMSSYAQKLLDGHEKIKDKWPERVIKMQKEWIGRSEGARLDFKLEGFDDIISVFTTRPDTVYGVTFMSLAPEHPIIEKLLKNNPRENEIREAVKRMRNQSAIERTSEESEKEGIFTGHYVINPFNGEKVQLWIANYALMEYGTGAVMAVPAHDQRDFLFAKKYGLPIKVVIKPKDKDLDPEKMDHAFEEDGIQVNSGPFDGMENRKAIKAITQYAKDNGFGDFAINYRLKDWLLSRQRYWGAPIPIIYCDKCGTVPVPEKDLPVLLPENVEFLPTGDSPLKRCEEWQKVKCPKCGGDAKRETDTMDTFVDSSWYFLRYLTPRDDTKPFDKDLANKWLPVDLYIGGIEHATMHLIYARFFTMVLKDLGLIDFTEPFSKLFCQGMICKTAYRCPEHLWIPEEEVEFICEKCGNIQASQTDLSSSKVVCKACNSNVKTMHKGCGKEVEAEMAKMSKTKKNGISPDGLFEKYGADTVRVGILRLGPPDQDLVYSDSVMVGEHKFLQRIYKLINTLKEELKGVKRYTSRSKKELKKIDKDLRRKAHQTLVDARETFEKTFSFNTLIARLHELLKEITKSSKAIPEVKREAIDILLFSLAPFAPHLVEELWETLGEKRSIFKSKWPRLDKKALKIDEIEIVVQINGKIKARTNIPVNLPKKEVEKHVFSLERIKELTKDKKIKKVIVVPNKLVNIIV